MWTGEQLLDVLAGVRWSKWSHKDAGMGRDAQIPHEGGPEQIDEIGSGGKPLDERASLLVHWIPAVGRIHQDVGIERRAHSVVST